LSGRIFPEKNGRNIFLFPTDLTEPVQIPFQTDYRLAESFTLRYFTVPLFRNWPAQAGKFARAGIIPRLFIHGLGSAGPKQIMGAIQ
jgi:hypothetical protein